MQSILAIYWFSLFCLLYLFVALFFPLFFPFNFSIYYVMVMLLILINIQSLVYIMLSSINCCLCLTRSSICTNKVFQKYLFEIFHISKTSVFPTPFFWNTSYFYIKRSFTWNTFFSLSFHTGSVGLVMSSEWSIIGDRFNVGWDI